MNYEEAAYDGSFAALGNAFNFQYNAQTRVLSILNAATGRPLCNIDLDKNLAEKPKIYVRLLERACQIEALKLSNNATIHLTDTLDENKLSPILKTVSRSAAYAFDLEQEKFQHFEHRFCNDHNLAHLQIKQFLGYEPSSHFYTAHLETDARNAVSARYPSLPGLLNILAHKIMDDLVTKDLNYTYEDRSRSFMQAASRLAALNLILNKSFSPNQKLVENLHIPLNRNA